MANELAQWAKDQSPFLKMQAGETVVAKYLGYEFVQDSFNPGKQKVQYELEVDGKSKFFATGSGKAAFFFGNLKVGDFVKIEATGEGMKRRYDLSQVVDRKGDLTKEEADEITEDIVASD